MRKSLIGCSYWATTYRSLDPRPNPYGFGCILFQVPSIKDVASNYGEFEYIIVKEEIFWMSLHFKFLLMIDSQTFACSGWDELGLCGSNNYFKFFLSIKIIYLFIFKIYFFKIQQNSQTPSKFVLSFCTTHSSSMKIIAFEKTNTIIKLYFIKKIFVKCKYSYAHIRYSKLI